MDPKQSYNEKFTRFKDVMAGKIPDRVPVLPNAETWVFHFAKVSIKKAFTEDNNVLFEAIKKYSESVYSDGILSISNTIPLKMGQALGSGLYQVSDTGVQIVGSHGKLMEPGEYPELAKDPKKFFANVLTPRKFPVFSESLEKSVELIKESYKAFADFNAYNGPVIKRIEEELGLPVLVKTTNYLPPDVVLDYLRDFVGISKDLRKSSDELLAACNSLFDFIMEMFYDTAVPPDGKVLFSPLHLPTYLRPPDFEKLYFPFMKRYVEELGVKRGYQIYFFMENDWLPYLDMLQDLPSDTQLVGLFEDGDCKFIKDKMKGKMIFMGGMPLNVLKLGTVQQAVDKAKECLDQLAPGGGYIFSTDKVLMSAEDAKAENLIAACEYVHVHGKY
jgi:hypothetical protein